MYWKTYIDFIVGDHCESEDELGGLITFQPRAQLGLVNFVPSFALIERNHHH